MGNIAFLLADLIQIYVWIVIASAILSWLVAFNVVDPRNAVVAAIGGFLYKITEPVLGPIRRYMPDLGGIDISPIVLIIGLWIVQGFLYRMA